MKNLTRRPRAEKVLCRERKYWMVPSSVYETVTRLSVLLPHLTQNSRQQSPITLTEQYPHV